MHTKITTDNECITYICHLQCLYNHFLMVMLRNICIILVERVVFTAWHVVDVIEHFKMIFVFQFLKKLNRQERVVEEVKLVLKPHYNKKHITKEDYKDILRRAVPKVH